MISWSIAMSGTSDAGSPAYAIRKMCGGPLRKAPLRVQPARIASAQSTVHAARTRYEVPRMFIARAPTATTVISEMMLCTVIIIFALGVSGMTSVGLKAAAVLNASDR